jgi:alanyl-tRNA synthetase
LECESQLCQIGEDQNYWHLVFEQTPFYGESGGQVGDTGTVRVGDRTYDVVDTLHVNDRVVHLVKKAGDFPKNSTHYKLEVDQKRRRDTACNHTGTHLLQAALRRVLGEQVHQSGSMVSPERLRFDFTHYEKVSDDQLKKVEALVNEAIGMAYPVCTTVMAHDEAVATGAMALFGEKYVIGFGWSPSTR